MKVSKIIIKRDTILEFTYTDALDGRYTVAGPLDVSVVTLLHTAEAEGRRVPYALPRYIFNPRAFAWIYEVLREAYPELVTENEPWPEDYGDYSGPVNPDFDY